MNLDNKSIVVTNDDGHDAKGLDVLKKIAKNISDNVWVLAPATNQSAKSHSISINKAIKVKKKNLARKNTTKHNHYSKYYDEECKDIVSERYKEDLENFNYKF